LNVTVHRLALHLVEVLRLPDSLLPTVSEAIEKKARADAITPKEAHRAIWERSLCWLIAGRRIDEKWFKTARYNAWPRPSRYGQHNRSTAQRPRRTR
jgi:hypothetical protein